MVTCNAFNCLPAISCVEIYQTQCHLPVYVHTSQNVTDLCKYDKNIP